MNMPKEIDIPFCYQMKKAISNGKKTMTSRYKRYGEAYDWFELCGKRFVITAVYKDILKNVADKYEKEGFETREDFIRTWKQLHPKKGYRENDKVWVHEFKEMKE